MSPTRNHPVPLYSPSAKLVVVADYGGQTKQQVNRPSSRRRNEHVKGHMRCKQCACCLPQAKVNANRGTTAATYQSPHGLHAHPVTLHGCRECPSSQQIAKHCLLAMEQVGIGTQVFKAQSHRRAVCWQTDQPISKAEGGWSSEECMDRYSPSVRNFVSWDQVMTTQVTPQPRASRRPKGEPVGN